MQLHDSFTDIYLWERKNNNSHHCKKQRFIAYRRTCRLIAIRSSDFIERNMNPSPTNPPMKSLNILHSRCSAMIWVSWHLYNFIIRGLMKGLDRKKLVITQLLRVAYFIRWQLAGNLFWHASYLSSLSSSWLLYWFLLLYSSDFRHWMTAVIFYERMTQRRSSSRLIAVITDRSIQERCLESLRRSSCTKRNALRKPAWNESPAVRLSPQQSYDMWRRVVVCLCHQNTINVKRDAKAGYPARIKLQMSSWRTLMMHARIAMTRRRERPGDSEDPPSFPANKRAHEQAMQWTSS